MKDAFVIKGVEDSASLKYSIICDMKKISIYHEFFSFHRYIILIEDNIAFTDHC